MAVWRHRQLGLPCNVSDLPGRNCARLRPRLEEVSPKFALNLSSAMIWPHKLSVSNQGSFVAVCGPCDQRACGRLCMVLGSGLRAGHAVPGIIACHRMIPSTAWTCHVSLAHFHVQLCCMQAMQALHGQDPMRKTLPLAMSVIPATI